METDDAPFVDNVNSESLDIGNSPYSVGKNISKQPKKERNNSQELERDSRTLNDFQSE